MCLHTRITKYIYNKRFNQTNVYSLEKRNAALDDSIDKIVLRVLSGRCAFVCMRRHAAQVKRPKCTQHESNSIELSYLTRAAARF